MDSNIKKGENELKIQKVQFALRFFSGRKNRISIDLLSPFKVIEMIDE
jgi:hypothetical protein